MKLFFPLCFWYSKLRIYFAIRQKQILHIKYFYLIKSLKNKGLFLVRISRLRQNEYYTEVKPLREKFPNQNLNDLAKRGRCNIYIWFQAKKSQDPKLLVRSDSNYSDDLNLITKNKSHPYSPLQYQLNIDELQAKIHHRQSQKIREITIWEGLSKKLNKTKEEFIQIWGEYISIENESDFLKKFGFGYSVFSDLNEDYYNARKICSSLKPEFSFIVKPEDGERFHIDKKVVEIIDKSYLQHYFCQKTEGCAYKVSLHRQNFIH